MKGSKRKIVAQINGGLGNQLFQYFASLFFANTTGSDLILRNSNYLAHLNSFIGDFKFYDGLLFKQKKTSNFITKIHEYFRFHFSVYKIFSNFISPHYEETQKTFEYEKRNFKSEFLKKHILKTFEIKGYFQDFNFYLNLPKNERILALKHPSKWYQDIEIRIRSKRSIMVHIRRQDFINFADRYGLLSAEYYGNAVRYMLDKYPDAIFWIFSDDMQKAKDILPTHLEGRFNFVIPPHNSSAAESLLLMASCDGHIVANSTYSIWAAFISQGNLDVLVPEPLFKGQIPLIRGLPASWIKFPSLWENLDDL